MAARPERHRYIFFLSPKFPIAQHCTQFDCAGVQVGPSRSDNLKCVLAAATPRLWKPHRPETNIKRLQPDRPVMRARTPFARWTPRSFVHPQINKRFPRGRFIRPRDGAPFLQLVHLCSQGGGNLCASIAQSLI